MRYSNNVRIHSINRTTPNLQGQQPVQSYEEFRRQYPQEGFLKAQVFAGDRGFPIPGVMVEIRKIFPSGIYTINTQQTDESGLTQPIPLPAHPAGESQQPGNGQPYSTYDVRFTHPDYTESIVHNVSVFEGITSLQPMEMIPKGAAPNGQTIMEFNVRQSNTLRG